MVDATVGFTLEKLGNLISDEVSTRRGVKDGLRSLREELGYLQASVRVAESNQEMDHLTRQWIDNVRDVANEVLLILDCVSGLEDDHAAGVLDRVQSLCKKQVNLYRIGKKIKSVKEKIVEIKSKRQDYLIPNHLTSVKGEQRKRTILRATSFENHVDVVGFEDVAKTLLDEILRDEPSLSVISIHGMGGLGKTTLAGKLYHSKELNHFKSRAWVCVSQEYNIKDVLKRIIKSFEGHERNLSDLDEIYLRQILRKLLGDRDSYLAVIDDVWDIRAWDTIKKAFPDKKNGSRVIITTRNKNVAERVDDRCFVHELRFLRKEESWQLFCKKVNPTRDFEKSLGEEMVGRCGGLPLAIVVLSGLLSHKKSYNDWTNVKDHIWKQLKGDPVRSVEIEDILSLSYDDLSFNMRRCFLYIARFPEDHSFRVGELMQLWIAEEFILEEERDGEVMEDVTEDYLNELINRNMIQIAVLELNGQVRECRVHDLVRDLAIQKANEDKLLVILDLSKEKSSPIRLLPGQTRHVIYNGIGKYLDLHEPSSDNVKLRSLTLSNEIATLKSEEIKFTYTIFKYLKVLDLTGACSARIPKVIGNLDHLKFLGLMGHRDSNTPLEIPSTIGKLKKLQTLRGSRYSQYIVPRAICELKELRHLVLRNFNFTQAKGSFHIKSHQKTLQTLAFIRYEDWLAIHTVNLTSLSTLVISNPSTREHVNTLDSLSSLTSLHTLVIQCSAIPTINPLSSCKRLNKVSLIGTMKDPSDLIFLPNSVTQLTLVRSEFIQDPMPALERLSNLIGLDLNRIYMGKKMVCSQNAFPCLQYLNLRDLPSLEEWEVEDQTLPSLEGFNMDSCQKLKIPLRLQGVPPIPGIFRFVTCTDGIYLIGFMG